MTNLTTCPSQKELERLALGQLPEQRLDAISEHFRDCAVCQKLMDNMEPEGELATAIEEQPARGHKPSAESREQTSPALNNLIQRLQQLGTLASSVISESSGSATGVLPEEEVLQFLAPAQQPDELGRLAHYRVLKLLGRGGIGMVFLAEDVKLNRQVAIKVLRTKYARRPAARERLLREARSLAGVRHDNIAVLHEIGEVEVRIQESGVRGQQSGVSSLTPDSCLLTPERVPYLVLDLLEGQDLMEWMEHNPKRRIETILRIGRETACGLAAAHARGLVHRDIKSGNLWLESRAQRTGIRDQDFRMKILDFGLAAPADEQAGETVGTPAYMAPEQIRGEPLDARCDLFALGCVLYELCTGKLPFKREVTAIRERRVDDSPPRPIQQLNPTVPVPLAKLVHRLLSPLRDDRPRSAAEVEQRLAKIERRLWFIRQPRWVQWAVAGTLLAFVGGLVLGFGPFVWTVIRYGTKQSEPVILDRVIPEGVEGLPSGAPSEAWRRLVGELPPRKQAAAVAAKLKELNPAFDGVISTVRIENDKVVELSVPASIISDIRPLEALTSLHRLRCEGSQYNPGRVLDLTPLENLPLQELSVRDNASLRDLRPLRKMRLTSLDISGTAVASLDELDGSEWQSLDISYTQVRDLAILKDRPNLRTLACFYCPFESLKPLVGNQIEHLSLTYRPQRDREVLLRMPKLALINSLPAQAFWQREANLKAKDGSGMEPR